MGLGLKKKEIEWAWVKKKWEDRKERKKERKKKGGKKGKEDI